MFYQPIHRHNCQADTTYSALSVPSLHTDETYEIHLVKSADENYVPADMEVWPMFHSCILGVLQKFPDAHRSAIEACNRLKEQIKGRENRRAPKGTGKF